MQSLQTIQDVLDESVKTELYPKLIQQINKDFLLANIDLDFDEAMIPSGLKLMLHETIYKLIQEKFTDYLNLLYIIDVPEKKVKQLDGSDMLKLSEDVSFLILLRVWQKVWYRNND